MNDIIILYDYYIYIYILILIILITQPLEGRILRFIWVPRKSVCGVLKKVQESSPS